MNGAACFHCALPVDRIDEFQVEIDGDLKPVCCPGCKAVAELIRDTGMSSYYAMREAPRPGVGRPPDDATEWDVFNSADMLTAFADVSNDHAEVTIYVGGMYCAACSWLIESTLSRQTGIISAEVNPVTHRLRVCWRPDEVGLGGVLAVLAQLGYEPQPLAPESTARPEVLEQRMALKRLLVASLGMMQAMMFAIGLYAGDYQGMDADMQHFLRLVSFAVTTPVVFYAARPFFSAAWRGIISRRPGMDLPVSIAIGSAYAASVFSTFTKGDAVWYDSVAMFVFFLTLGRFIEMRARHRSIDRSAALSSLLPNTVNRIDNGSQTVVPVSQLLAGDQILVRPGEPIPADGVLVEGTTTIDESLLSGEAAPQNKSAGSTVIAGTINLDGLIQMRVDKTGSDTTLGTISRLSERARYARPAFVQLADRIAGLIVIAILAIASLVAAFWYVTAPDRAFVITLSVLVVTCPCALALATPAAFAAAATRLAELRLLVTNGSAIEALSKASFVIFDKTGTLTSGTPTVVASNILDRSFDTAQCVAIAAALETVSTHPIAQAFSEGDSKMTVTGQRVAIGEGVVGTIDGRRWRLGTEAFASDDSRAPSSTSKPITRVFLGADGHLVASFDLQDQLRPRTGEVLQQLRDLGLSVGLASGDAEEPARQVAVELEIDNYHSNCTPEDKLRIIQAAQQEGETVVMVGDGINDAPVLAGADASLAMADGALLAQTNADIIMLGGSLEPLVTALKTAKQTMRIVRQNLVWAIVYNAVALPAAAAGFVPPWAAAIGMSASSLIVVLNALRLSRFGEA
jgi:Cu2+-exporting ATPase